MKLPFKHIAILVIISLTGIFAYQVYWLTGLYHTMKEEMERNIAETMRMSDYNEMMLRVEYLRKSNEQHGEVSVSAGYSGVNSFVRSSASTDHEYTFNQRVLPSEDTIPNMTYSRRNDSISVIYPNDSTKVEVRIRRDTVTRDSSGMEKESALTANENMGMILQDKKSMLELAAYFQRGLHAGLDVLMEPDFRVYDSLLTVSLKNMGIDLPHRTEYLHSGSTVDSSYVYTDTLGIGGDSTYIPGPKAIRYTYDFDLFTNGSYCLIMEPVNLIVLKQMSGILITSFIIFVILGSSFWYLIHTILRQKTLEEMTSDFTNNITHELKTPISVAYAANDALLNFGQAEDKTRREKYLRICQEQLQRLSGLVEQILSMSMERRKTFRLHPETIELHSFFDSLIELHTLKADKPIRITYDIEPKSLTVIADRTHFSNIISNLIDNAVKYSVGEAVIDIKCYRHSEKVLLVLSDKGIGISAEKQKYIFNKFYRVSTGNLHEVKGYGLGLYYVRTMIEQHGGTVSVESEPGHGSTFTLTMNV